MIMRTAVWLNSAGASPTDHHGRKYGCPGKSKLFFVGIGGAVFVPPRLNTVCDVNIAALFLSKSLTMGIASGSMHATRALFKLFHPVKLIKRAEVFRPTVGMSSVRDRKRHAM
jgi:hypothetical protein